jgi:hypothetical protein
VRKSLEQLGCELKIRVHGCRLLALAFTRVRSDVAIKRGIDLTTIEELRQIFERMNFALLQIGWRAQQHCQSNQTNKHCKGRDTADPTRLHGKTPIHISTVIKRNSAIPVMDCDRGIETRSSTWRFMFGSSLFRSWRPPRQLRCRNRLAV